MDGFNKNATSINGHLIGQLGKNDNCPPDLISLEEILQEIFSIIDQVRALIGGRMIVLECEDTPSLIAHYEKHGFSILPIRECVDQAQYVTMYTVVTS